MTTTQHQRTEIVTAADFVARNMAAMIERGECTIAHLDRVVSEIYYGLGSMPTVTYVDGTVNPIFEDAKELTVFWLSAPGDAKPDGGEFGNLSYADLYLQNLHNETEVLRLIELDAERIQDIASLRLQVAQLTGQLEKATKLAITLKGIALNAPQMSPQQFDQWRNYAIADSYYTVGKLAAAALANWQSANEEAKPE